MKLQQQVLFQKSKKKITQNFRIFNFSFQLFCLPGCIFNSSNAGLINIPPPIPMNDPIDPLNRFLKTNFRILILKRKRFVLFRERYPPKIPKNKLL